jgi:predicted N-acetyltransferase YhbS
MPDMLVNLLRLPSCEAILEDLKVAGVEVRRAQPFEITPIKKFVSEQFSTAWADEISVGFANKPISVFVATLQKNLVGFAAFECTRKAFFGPLGVAKANQGRGIGKALVICCLHGLREMGYVYGVIGGVGPIEFYQDAVGATVIPESEPGIYTDILK